MEKKQEGSVYEYNLSNLDPKNIIFEFPEEFVQNDKSEGEVKSYKIPIRVLTPSGVKTNLLIRGAQRPST